MSCTTKTSGNGIDIVNNYCNGINKELNINKLEQLLTTLDDPSMIDASGKMRGKLRSLVSIIDQIKEGLEVVIFSMKEKNTLKKYLKGEEVELTKVVYN